MRENNWKKPKTYAETNLNSPSHSDSIDLAIKKKLVVRSWGMMGS
jgi:hypothetical protein